MNRTKIFVITALIFCLTAVGGFAQTPEMTKTNLSQAEIDRVVKGFTQHEGEFRQALADYVFNRTATIQTVGLGGQITGTYRRDSFLALSPEGARFEKIIFAPVPTLTEITVSANDIDNLNGTDPFSIDPKYAAQYNFTYLGKEKIDDLNLYVFDVAPKIIPDAKKTKLKFFSGRIWVDDQDLAIVKSKGKAIPLAKDEQFPIIETYRENIEGKYWFPSFSTSDDTLVFDSGQAVKVKVRVKYSKYTKGKSEVTILDDDPPVQENKPPTPAPTPKKP